MPLVMPVESDCSFCAYLERRRAYTILERRPQTSVLVTREQRGVGHLLVVPTAHRPTLFDLLPAEGAEIMSTLQRTGRAISATYDLEGIAVWQKNGAPAHQSIAHAHFHIAGTLPGGGTTWGPVPELTVEQTDGIAAQLAPHLAPP